MKKQQVIDHFGSVRAVSDALGITYQSVREWPEEVPEGRQFQIQVITNGQLTVDPGLLPKKSSAA